MEKKPIEVKKWHIEITTFDDGSTEMMRTNDGFNPIELLGLLSFAHQDIVNQIKGEIKPDVIKRNVIKD